MKGFDAFAGAIKSGGKTRRAAKMVILDADHPDIEDFIAAKGKEELKAAALVREGYDGSGPDSEAYASIAYQNANNSVRVTDEFMEAAINGRDWDLKARKDGSTIKTIKAADLLRQVATETHLSGDPGMQFDTTINSWHTSKVSGRINASNPCSEYMFLDDSACNLASFNLVKFLKPTGEFDAVSFSAAVRLLVIAMDVLVDMAGYPTEKIAQMSHDFRPLGLGYANLGALLMNLGLPYDSADARSMAGAITSLMGGAATLASVEIASNNEQPRSGHGPLQRFHDWLLPGLCKERGLDAGSGGYASEGKRNARPRCNNGRIPLVGCRSRGPVESGSSIRNRQWLPECAAHRPRTNWHDWLFDGLLHHWHRANDGPGHL